MNFSSAARGKCHRKEIQECRIQPPRSPLGSRTAPKAPVWLTKLDLWNYKTPKQQAKQTRDELFITSQCISSSHPQTSWLKRKTSQPLLGALTIVRPVLTTWSGPTLAQNFRWSTKPNPWTTLCSCRAQIVILAHSLIKTPFERAPLKRFCAAAIRRSLMNPQLKVQARKSKIVKRMSRFQLLTSVAIVGVQLRLLSSLSRRFRLTFL